MTTTSDIRNELPPSYTREGNKANTDPARVTGGAFDRSAYLMCWRPNKVWFIGPFESADAAHEWASDATNNPSDDPHWQILPMIDPNAPLEVVPPTAPMPDSSALWQQARQLYHNRNGSGSGRLIV